MKKSQTYFGIGLLAVLLLVGAGCGSDDTDTSAKNTKPETTVTVGVNKIISSKNLLENINTVQELDTFARIASVAGANDVLRDTEPVTVFAPDIGAFEQALGNIDVEWLKPANKAKARAGLQYHIVLGRYTLEQLRDGMTLTTLTGKTLRFSQKGDQWIINDSAIIDRADGLASNGVIHVIDRVLVAK